MRQDLSIEFLTLTQKAWFISGKIDKLNIIKNLNFYSVKDPVKRMKRQVTSWEKIISNHVSNKGLASRIYNELWILKSKNKKNKSTFWKVKKHE